MRILLDKIALEFFLSSHFSDSIVSVYTTVAFDERALEVISELLTKLEA